MPIDSYSAVCVFSFRGVTLLRYIIVTPVMWIFRCDMTPDNSELFRDLFLYFNNISSRWTCYTGHILWTNAKRDCRSCNGRTRKRRGPRKRWRDEVGEDTNVMGIKYRQAMVSDPEEWRKILLGAKVHNGLQCLRRRRRRRRRRRGGRRRKLQRNLTTLCSYISSSVVNWTEDITSTGLLGKRTGMCCLKCVDSAGKMILKRLFERYGFDILKPVRNSTYHQV